MGDQPICFIAETAIGFALGVVFAFALVWCFVNGILNNT